MSLITLNSSGSPNPAYYTSHLSQPITIKPYSQVCLMKFLHFKNAGVFNVNLSNNTFFYVIGSLAATVSGAMSSPIRVELVPGQYTGDQLASHITIKMMEGIQQQNFSLLCTFTAGDPTHSPQTFDKFEISYTSVIRPDTSSPKYEFVPNTSVNGSIDAGTGAFTPSTTGTQTEGTEYSAVSTGGIVTHLGSYETTAFRLDPDTYGSGDAATWTATLRTAKVGLVRDLLSNTSDENVNKRYSEDLLDVGIGMGGGATSDSIIVSSLSGSSVSWGNPNYVTTKIQRTIKVDPIVKALLATNVADAAKWALFRFKFVITASQTAIGRAICQMYYSLDGGGTAYQPVPAGTGAGTDDNNYIKTFTSPQDEIEYDGAFWVSDQSTYQNTGITIQANLLRPRRAPFHPICYFSGAQVPGTIITTQGRMNAKDNLPMTTFSIQGSDHKFTPDEIASRIAESLTSEDGAGPSAEPQAAGPDLSTKVIIFAGQITEGALEDPTLQVKPVFIGTNRYEGTAGGLLGFHKPVYVTTDAATEGSIAVSDMLVQRVSRDNVLMVSIPELSGLKSYQGIDKGIGKHLTGEAKVLSVLPREEFTGTSDNGHLVYVAPFENWLDVNNAGPIVLNQLTIEVRILSGEIADDLSAITTAQIKFREDPSRAAAQYQRDLISVLRGDTQQTGQILSSNIQMVGS